MWKDAIEILQKEWGVLSSAPWAFAISSVVVFSVAFTAIKWRYDGIVENLRERLETMKERLTAKDTQLDEYRERLHLVPASGSEFSRLTHAELKQRTLKLVDDLRK
jgi:hypothetical protein